MFEEMEPKCEICQKFAQKSCANCRQVFYCSKEHQKDGWKKHKKTCRPFKIYENEKLGRYLVATRTLEPREIILIEAPIIWGPSQDTIPICLGCGKEITSENSRPCYKCGWPVCSELCEKSPSHIPECKYTAQRGKVAIKNFGVAHPLYQYITILRCLYQKQFLPKLWKKLSVLESHDDVRKQSKKYEEDRVKIAQFIRRYFKLTSTFSDEEILTISGIISVNSHEVPLTDPSYIAIFENSSLFQHDCRANCSKSFTNDGKILIAAAQKIEKNECLSICYTDALWGTQNRRQFLYDTKYFWCHCQRCEDSTEFNTYFSALKCQNSNCNGYLLASLEDGKFSKWNCNSCHYSMIHNSIVDILEIIGTDLENLDKEDPKQLGLFLGNYKQYLPPNHHYFIEVKNNLSQILGQNQQLTFLSLDDLLLKIRMCEDLIELLPKIATSEMRTLGVIWFEYHAALAEHARRITNKNDDEARLKLCESRKALEKAVQCLKHEPDVLPEGKIYVQAKKNLELLSCF